MRYESVHDLQKNMDNVRFQERYPFTRIDIHGVRWNKIKYLNCFRVEFVEKIPVPLMCRIWYLTMSPFRVCDFVIWETSLKDFNSKDGK